MAKFNLASEARKLTGHKVKNLRKEGLLPANIFGKDVDSTAIQIKNKEFMEVYKKAGETGIVEIKLGKEDRPVLVHHVQVHPVTGAIIHVDFLQVNLKEKVTANIPVEVIGESPAEKSGEGTVVLLIQELEAEALPMDLPDSIEIDATKLTEVDQTVKVADLKYDRARIQLTDEPDSIVVKVEPPQKEEVIEAPVPVEGETPVAEGEKPAEGAEKPAAEEKPQEQK